MAKLTEVCANIKNYFLRSDSDIKNGTFDIRAGVVPLTSLLPGQYFRISGSILNDGVWQNVEADLLQLRPETFTGSIWVMSVPRDFEDLCNDIDTWRTKNEGADSANMSPFNSESFGGYSYSKGGSGATGGGSAVTWQNQFRARLNTYRRISL
ncbi:MAG: hypothetical protein IKS58_00760 [Paludibacteraceae bacterium]|nr:hypothetical protein [Paludibacteraceae bacterium]